MSKLELLSPAGDLECLDAALRFGADAVYVGGPRLQLRAGAVGFTMEALAEAVRRAHALGRRLYVAVNAFAADSEIDALPDYARALADLGVDAVIAADPGVIAALRHAAPDLPVHVSTQANCLSAAAARVYADMGCARVVLGREMTLEDIRTAHARLGDAIELEAFVHGAMCMAYSGRCMISAYLTDRSANRGACTQPCRWQYHLMEQTRPGEFFPVEEDDRGTTILSSFDLNCLDFLDQIIAAGVTSFKLEGRMKTPYYVATVTNAYRRRIDEIVKGTATPESTARLMAELDAVSHRAYASGFYFGAMKKHAPDDGVYRQDCVFAGVVLDVPEPGRIRVDLRNRIRRGDVLELLSPNSLGVRFAADHMTNAEGRAIDLAAVPRMAFDMDAPEGVAPGDMLRIRRI